MLVKTDKNYTFKFWFEYPHKYNQEKNKRLILCLISVRDDTLENKEFVRLCVGTATKHPNDKYDKHFGRKIAFKHALDKLTNSLNLSKEQRTVLWKIFFESFPRSKK